MYSKLASAIYNDIYSGLQGMHIGNSLTLEQLEDEIVSTRLAVIKEFQLKGLITDKDLTIAINCIQVDCKNLERCCFTHDGTKAKHFEIPQLLNGEQSIQYIGRADREEAFIVYVGHEYINWSKYRKRGRMKPYVWVDPVPNANNMYDCYLFNAPFLEYLSVVAAFKDLRQLERWSCCLNLQDLDIMPLVDQEVRTRITKTKLYYYRQAAASPAANDQSYK